MSQPTVYMFDQRDGMFSLYLGGTSTVQGLRLLNADSMVRVESIFFDASIDAPPLEPDHALSVLTLIEMLGDEDSVGPHDFACAIDGTLRMSTHDDGECSFQSPTKPELQKILIATTDEERAEFIWDTITTNAGKYITCNSEMEAHVYDNFDAYINSLRI